VRRIMTERKPRIELANVAPNVFAATRAWEDHARLTTPVRVTLQRPAVTCGLNRGSSAPYGTLCASGVFSPDLSPPSHQGTTKHCPATGFGGGPPLENVRAISRARLRFLRSWSEQVLWCLGALVVNCNFWDQCTSGVSTTTARLIFAPLPLQYPHVFPIPQCLHSCCGVSPFSDSSGTDFVEPCGRSPHSASGQGTAPVWARPGAAVPAGDTLSPPAPCREETRSPTAPGPAALNREFSGDGGPATGGGLTGTPDALSVTHANPLQASGTSPA
jgi:hypothetical protein